MKLVVMKFGGTSVGSIYKINNVANIVEKQLQDKKLIVVFRRPQSIFQLDNQLNC